MDNQDKTVWIVIPTWNRRDDLIACLNSLKYVTYSPIQILVIDNASEDGTFQVVSDKYPEVIIQKMESNIGASAASNVGFDIALNGGADYILRLDSDTIVSPDFLEPLVNLLEKNNNIGVVSPKIYYYEPADLIWYAGVDAHPWHFGAINDIKNKRDNETSCRSRDVDYVWGAAMLIRREVLEKIGGFDPDFFIYYEEVDFCKQVHLLGYRIHYTSESKIWHKVGTQNLSQWTAFNWNRSKIILFHKYSRNLFHKFSLTLYAFLYAVLDAIIFSLHIRKISGNRGPLNSAIKGLLNGLQKSIIPRKEKNDPT